MRPKPSPELIDKALTYSRGCFPVAAKLLSLTNKQLRNAVNYWPDLKLSWAGCKSINPPPFQIEEIETPVRPVESRFFKTQLLFKMCKIPQDELEAFVEQKFEQHRERIAAERVKELGAAGIYVSA